MTPLAPERPPADAARARPSVGSALRAWLGRVDGPHAAPLACLLAGGLSAAVAMALDRPGATAGAAVATAVVLMFFATGALPVLLVGGDTSKAAIGFLILMMSYGLRLVAVLLVLVLASRSSWVDVRWLALTVIGLALVWTTTSAALVGRSRATL